MNFHENACKTLIIYQINQNKSMIYKDKDDNKNLKRGDVVSIDWINAGDLDDCQFYGALFVGYAS